MFRKRKRNISPKKCRPKRGSIFLSPYKKPLRFGDEFAVLPEILEFKGIRLVIGYTFTLAGETVATGKTTHCFLTPEGRPIALKRQFPEFDSVLKGLVKS
jgi:acyl-CoA thioester hydrolase